jgi:hypothetical protein
MANNGNDTLHQATQSIQKGDFNAAQSLLANYLRANPRSDQAWYLLSLCMQTEEHQIDCLQRAVALNPANTQAQYQLKQLISPRNASSAPFTFEPEDRMPLPQNPVEPFTFGATEKPSEYETWEPLDPVDPPPKLSAAPGKSKSSHPMGSARKTRQPDPVHSIPRWLVWMAIGLSVLTILVCLGGAVVLLQRRAEASRLAIEATKNYFPTLPPTWTPTPPAPPTETPFPTATRIPSPTPTLPAPPVTALAQMDRIQKQVADLRGLKIEAEVPRFLITPLKAKEMLSASLLNDEGRDRLRNLARALSAFGFIKPTYDLSNYAINASVDGVGGFYEPWSKNIFVLGAQFSTMQRYVYAHEFDHALVDQHFLLTDMGVYPQCQRDSEQCSAIRALVEGDATLLMNQWLQQYASPSDLRELANYQPPAQALPEDFTPPAITQDLCFPYIQGEAFVEHLYKKGKWAGVNQAYANPPETSEQILHPEKYDAHEPAIAVEPAPLEGQLGSAWQEIASDVFGEWNTYLLLAYGADIEAQLKTDVAQKAAAGWGGDHYQVLLQSQTNQTALALDWSWDSRQDADEFMPAMEEYLDARFRGNKLDRSQGECWQANTQTTCLYQAGSATLWLLAPDADTIDQMLVGFPAFH